MSEYPFSEREQDAIRELGRLAFCYSRETKKAIEFVDKAGRIILLNREHSSLALVFDFGDETRLHGTPGVITIGSRASSNLTNLDLDTTRTGRLNHSGLQVVLQNRAAISTAVNRLL